MYVRSAQLYDLMHPNLDYQAATTRLRQLVDQHRPGAKTLLDVACGTGRHVELLCEHFEVQGLDINAEMLSAARKRCPEVIFHQADMRSFALGRRFDVVTCLFGSLGYVESYEELATTIGNLRDHVEPGGLIVVEPWLSPADYRVGPLTTHTAAMDGTTVSWMYCAAIEDDRSIFDIHHLVGTRAGVEHFVERHSLALFSPTRYEEAFRDSGLEPETDPDGFFGYGLVTAKVG
jgi:SAM-dependent methyltransferase